MLAELAPSLVQTVISSVYSFEIYPSRITKKVRDKSITYNIFRIQDNDALMCRMYCIAFIWYMLAGKTLSNYTNLFSPNDYKKNVKIVYKYFKDKYVKSGV